MNNQEIHVCITFRQLIFAVIDLSNKNTEGVIVFLIDYQNISFDIRYRLIKNFKKIKFLFIKENCMVNEFSCFSERIPGLLRRNLSFSLTDMKIFLGTRKWVPEIFKKYYFDVAYIYHSGPFVSKVMRAVSDKIILREDGLSNYLIHPITLIKAISRLFFFLSPTGQVWGEEKWVNSLQVESPEKLPMRVIHKASKISFEEIASKLSLNNRQKLLDSFSFEACLPKTKNIKTCLILTQPIDSVGICSTKDKIFFYNIISEKFLSLGYIVYMKNHPKEKVFSLPNVIDLAREFPVELISFVADIKFTYCVALCSTSIASNAGKLAVNNIQFIPLHLYNKDNLFLWKKLIERVKLH
ncbi:hypothetical protein A9798_10775 [Edwardsiella hoshinae]|uniref:Capsule polysaccharide biosynthesis protein n=1 Tax=Edwardsiella hoshinae TaxID=93378 RepID=A0ABN4SXW8_9GAMM|nr:polysialyltransferase family glycosyltransferase [Edwardsiella hoshinae]AOV97390.1 hypothetical protein A9798_10775 [Edwardsiella hoshinae]